MDYCRITADTMPTTSPCFLEIREKQPEFVHGLLRVFWYHTGHVYKPVQLVTADFRALPLIAR